MSRVNLACILTIAGTDPSGGAGIQADIKAISATGGYAASVITSLVAQNTCGVRAIEPVSAGFVQEQLDCVFDDLTVKACKIGMLHDQQIIEIVASTIEKRALKFIVWDPVMVAKDGSLLLERSAIALLKKRFLALPYLMTPNLFEAEQLINKTLSNTQDMQNAALLISQQFATNVLLKGGHLDDAQASDVLYVLDDNSYHWFSAQRINTRHTHGTGCSLSAAISSYLGQGFALQQAINLAKNYLTDAIKAGQKMGIGKGKGPVDHFYFLNSRC
jgi:hydroxymethylpyrimidine/phosphomethylpyrimidine kinase